MACITYTALREMEPTGYSKTGTDISAAAADDSFNATSTVLTGLLDNEWARVNGFANAANNGQFQAFGNSTATKILQDTSTVLVTEAAGPLVSIVGYKRGVGQSYDLEFEVETAPRKYVTESAEHRAIGGGAAEVIFQRDDVIIDVTALLNLNGSFITEAQLLQWREWRASVSSGEIFILDRYGSAAVPVEPEAVQLASKELSEERIGGFGALGLYRLSFSVRLVS